MIISCDNRWSDVRDMRRERVVFRSAGESMRPIITIGCLIALSACGHSEHRTSGSSGGLVDEIRSRGTVVVATEAALEPFEFVQDGKIVGYNKDVLDQVVAGLGVRLQQLNLPFQGILPGLIARKFDFVATSVTITPERAHRYAYTRPTGSVDEVVVVRANDMRIKAPDDLDGMVVATQLASSVQPLLEAHDAELKAKGRKGYASLRLFTSFPETHLALASGQVDAIAIDSPSAGVLMKKMPATYRVATSFGKSALLAWVTRPENLDLRDYIDSRIDALRESGKLRELQLKWFGFEMKTPKDGYLPLDAY
jgi:polar amino acid transport system substrate-binding protein